MPMNTDTFISYRRSISRYTALAVAQAFSLRGINVFVDTEPVDLENIDLDEGGA
jgi:hypothetical protein